MRRRLSFSLAVLLSALLVVPATARAQKATPGQVAYVEGVRAFDAGDYAKAAERMRVALAEDAVEATARFRHRAQNPEDYFPHLWLGLSLEKRGDLEGARAALAESDRQGAVHARPTLRRILSAALVRLTPPTPVPTATPRPEPAATPPAPLPAPEPTPGPVPGGALTIPAPTPVASRRVAATPVVRELPAPDGRAAVAAGVRAFLRGDYEGAEKLLAPEAARSPVARLYLAFSLGGRVLLLGKPADDELLRRARGEYAAALLAGAPLEPGPWVSPAIAELLGGAPGTGPSR